MTYTCVIWVFGLCWAGSFGLVMMHIYVLTPNVCLLLKLNGHDQRCARLTLPFSGPRTHRRGLRPSHDLLEAATQSITRHWPRNPDPDAVHIRQEHGVGGLVSPARVRDDRHAGG
jgi:hypothetical protein